MTFLIPLVPKKEASSMEKIPHRFFTVKYVEVLPQRHPCPDCGQPAKRNSIGERTLQEPNLDHPTFLIVRMSVCRCDHPRCDRKYFRVPLPFAAPGARYTDQAKGLCVSSITRDGMPFGRVPERVADDFHMYPSTSTVWEWHRQEAEGVDLNVDYAPWVKAQFSGVLCIDEVYDGPFCVILSTDPLNDVTVAYTLEKKAPGTQRPSMNQEWLDRHLDQLKRIGIHPQVCDARWCGGLRQRPSGGVGASSMCLSSPAGHHRRGAQGPQRLSQALTRSPQTSPGSSQGRCSPSGA